MRKRIGILGGGQLARMMILKGHELGIEVYVLCGAGEPAALVTSHWTSGDPNNETDVLEFSKKVDVLTVESEFFNPHHLKKVEDLNDHAVLVYPSSFCLSQLQDRGPQKALLDNYKIPTSPFIEVNNTNDFHQAAQMWKKFVLKKRHGGYDGFGTWIVDSTKTFDTTKIDWNQKYIAEKFVPFKRELAIQLARNLDGVIAEFPLVQTHQVDNRLDWLQGPIADKRLTAVLSRIKKMLHSIKYIGVIAFELFDSKEGLLVNEIAPRVHNSGHHSLESQSLDQFSAHLLCGLGEAPKKVNSTCKFFATINLIGTGQSAIDLKRSSQAKAKLHWYGKTASRLGRKMGHMTLTGNRAHLLLPALQKERKGLKI